MKRGSRIDERLVNASFENYAFQDCFGDPDSNIEWEGTKRLISYRCLDGMLQLTVWYSQSTVFVSGINEY